MTTPAGINRRLDIEVTDSLKARMDKRVAKGEPGECWPWTAGFRNGYGAIKHQRRVLSAHRVAYVIANGEPPEGTIVGHKCDNRSCCNPAHLEAITPAQNSRDAFERCDHQTSRGEEHYRAVLNEQLVTKVWQLKREGRNAGTIAKLLNQKRKTIESVLSGKSWKHLRPSWAA